MKKTQPDTVRLDKWLWAARFFKTRSLAAKAVNGGKVHLNGARTKAARAVKAGDDLFITRGGVEFKVKVLGLSLYRRPAVEARLLYEEYEESIKAREEKRELRRMFNAGFSSPSKKPGKRDRRKIKEFVRKG
ncbi:RNA-binding protein [Desulfomarina profundi]|uniref:RNA-binding protein n=1 Tax=Desulfomarina profundi TaxID=2772557 RepID=A0A8D5FES8_9BACT|nr:RNA-binding protein [Desulfomarina profundi]